jgi:hypothetical protein
VGAGDGKVSNVDRRSGGLKVFESFFCDSVMMGFQR